MKVAQEGDEDEMVGWRHQLNGHEFEQTPGVCSPGDGEGNWNCKLTLFSERGSGGEPPVKSEV